MQLYALQTLALSVAQARSPNLVLEEMVRGLGMSDGVALARVWLIESDPNSGSYLRLRASVGVSRVDPELRWTRTDGAHEKIPLSYGKVGRIAARGEPLLLQRGPRDWLLQPEWAEREGIESFAGQPLVFRGEVLGVVAIFSRVGMTQQELGWLRVFADHAAVAIANARAFEQIKVLKERLERERDDLESRVQEVYPGELVSNSPAMQRILGEVRAVAATDSSVLVLGESGVGKELIASAIHDSSPRSSGPLVKVNCASVPGELFESEFFGHVRGAFSGASRDREGRFQLAHGGTLFLDEVGEIPLGLQGKLLRVLQEQEFERVGDDRTRRVDVRLVAATNRDLEAEVRAGRFRSDLYYRLCVVPIVVPPLRERPEDMVPLARQFLKTLATRLNLEVPTLSTADEAALLSYPFPGNIRELRNVLERAVVLCRASGKKLELNLGERERPRTAESARDTEARAGSAFELGKSVIPLARFKELERENLMNALRLANGKVAGRSGAAALLGVKPSTLSYQLKSLGIKREG